MAAAYGPLEIPSWAIGAIFFFFLIVTLIWDKMLHALEHYLKKRNKPALSKALQGLKDEILAVGLIVLILPLFQNHLMKICVDMSLSDKAPGYNPHGWSLKPADIQTPYTTSLPDYPASSDSSYSSYPATDAAGRRLLVVRAAPSSSFSTVSGSSKNYTTGTTQYSTAAGSSTAATVGSSKNSTTGTAQYSNSSKTPTTGTAQYSDSSKNAAYDKAASAGKADKSNSAVCGPGKTQLFPYEALHGIHIFIALTALVHVFYAIVCLTLCTFRMRGWWKWEMEAQKSAAIPISTTIIRSVGRNPVMHVVMSIINIFKLRIGRSLYLSIRRLFLEGLKQGGQLDELPLDFPYFAYVQEAMQYSFCDVVAVSPMIWLFAIIQLIVPYGKRIWLTIGLCCATILLMIAAAAKLHSLVVHLAARAQFLYSGGFANPEAADTQVTVDTSAGGAAGTAEPQQQRREQAAKDVLRAAGQDQQQRQHHKQKKAAPSGHVLQRFKTYAARANLQEDLPSMFWFHRPRLLLTFFKIAYFQAAFCLTLVLYALWKDNQFLPDQARTPDVIVFFILLSLNIALSFFMSTCVLPVYAIVSVTDTDAFVAAGEFAERDMRHQDSLRRERHPGSGPDTFDELQHKQAMAVLHKLQSQVSRMHNLAMEEGKTIDRTPFEGSSNTRHAAESLSPTSTLGTRDSVANRDERASKRAQELWGSVRSSVRC